MAGHLEVLGEGVNLPLSETEPDTQNQPLSS